MKTRTWVGARARVKVAVVRGAGARARETVRASEGEREGVGEGCCGLKASAHGRVGRGGGVCVGVRWDGLRAGEGARPADHADWGQAAVRVRP